MGLSKLDPRTKLAWYVLMIYFSLISGTVVQLCLVLLAGIMASLILTGSLKQYKVVILILLFLGLQILVVQLIFCREGVLIYQWGILKIYSEALPLAITGLLKASIIVFASMQFFTSASPQEFTLMLMKFKIPYRFAMLVGLSVRFLPLMKAEYISIIDSQRTRGLRMESAWDNLKGIFPTFLPFLYRSVRRATETALAMELRGYGRTKTRTFTSNIALKPYDTVLISAMLVVIIISLTSKVLPLI
ncbi:energy-coupling factor transporter transmembrane component T family protein [Desulfosporosinus nitroreducens]|uniref:Energy-coupling factor transporter transmembrane protein EcfT n=1 Tax=Desulfosporosinus nitroreducens TaxID=2018668 RepID=A0ABT8QPC8_9FIRM|nr:energy-coupling factor transporter transmembrane component T [Desulfosporosinus nitroreducens]MCO1603358.1 energy-coupling factor transporter transmembrane protein EcfT [Desulfosporosinus nitroreducens]MDO0823198.1 energy-coupling factor transporter transmembrane protein EcfT [Desulfosporosinus nitroreducens]